MTEEANKQLFSEFPDVPTSSWEEKIIADLKGADYQKKLVWKSDEGIPVKPYYRQEDLEALDYLEGIDSLRNGSDAPNGWTICQDIRPGKECLEANERIKAALKGGAQAIRLQLSQARIPDVAMLEELLDGISLQDLELHFSGCLAADSIYSALCTLASQKDCDLSDLKGSLGADPLGKMAETGIPIGGLENIGKLVLKVKESSPKMKVIEVRGALIQNAGSTLVEELAFSLAMASLITNIFLPAEVDDVVE